MKHLFESIVGLRVKISNLLHYEASNSRNKIENNFYGTVNFIGKQPKRAKNKINSSHSRLIGK